MNNLPIESLQNDDFSDAVAAMLGELWDKSPRPVPADHDMYARVLGKSIRWIHLLRHRGLDVEVIAEGLYNRCRSDEPLLFQCGFFEEERSTTIARFKRTLAGIAQLVERRLPMDLRKSGKAVFGIRWEDDSAFGDWRGSPDPSSYNIRNIILTALQTFGEFTPTVCPLLASRVLKDLRSGVLILPNFWRDKSSDPMVTVLQWIQPGLELPQEESVVLDEVPCDFSGFLPEEEELTLWKLHPEMARVWDKILCSGAVQSFHGVTDT